MYKKLKPCPFCGGEGYINYERIQGEDKGCWAQVICKKCHARSCGTWSNSYGNAEKREINAWNRRANNGKIDVDDLIGYLGFKDTQEKRDNNYAQDITLEEIDRIETVNVEEREEVKKLIREAKKKVIDDFCKELQKTSVYARPVGWAVQKEIIEFANVKIIEAYYQKYIDKYD